MRRSTREATESPVEQGTDEKRTYSFDFAGLGTDTPTSPVYQLWDITDSTSWLDVTSTKVSGSASVSGSIVASPLIIELVAGHVYRLECKVNGAGGSVYEGYVRIDATR